MFKKLKNLFKKKPVQQPAYFNPILVDEAANFNVYPVNDIPVAPPMVQEVVPEKPLVFENLEDLFEQLSLTSGVLPAEKSAAKKMQKKLDANKKANSSGSAQKGVHYWSKGTGYGHNQVSNPSWNINAFVEEHKSQQSKIAVMSSKFVEFAEASKDKAALKKSIKDSCLLSFLVQHLRYDSVVEIDKELDTFISILDVCAFLASDELAELMFAPVGSSKHTVYSALAFHREICERAEKMDQEALKKLASDSDKADKEAEEAKSTALLLQKVAPIEEKLQQFEKKFACDVEEKKEEPQKPSTKSKDSEFKAREDAYVKIMDPLRFGEAEDFEFHHFKNANANASVQPMNRKTIRRLAGEFADLCSSLPLTLNSSIFMRVHSSDMSYLQMLILAPDLTPYGYGAFLFDVYIPHNYPQVPPKVNLQTTGKGTFRFNPNLYDSGYVCLSLLGTWSGQQGEQWNAQTSTLLQLAVSVQSLIFVPEPYFNEPGYESQIGTANGNAQSLSYNKNVRRNTMRLAMIDMIKNPPKGFEEVVLNHFALHKKDILEQAAAWKKDDGSLADVIKELTAALDSIKL